MLFNSLSFVGFFVVVYAVYLILSHRAQNWWLLLASYIFYAQWDWRFLLLMIGASVFNYACGLGMVRLVEPSQRRLLLITGLALNLMVLGVFKYLNFLLESFARLLQPLGLSVDASLLHLLLPLGISFYTFHNISYLMDVYYRRVEPARRFVDFGLYVAFFPQLIAGPIARPAHLLPQIEQPRHISRLMLREGFWLLLLGYFKKVVLADNMLPFAKPLFDDPQSAAGAGVWIGLWAFAFQIYGDFSGYSDIARGLSKLMGFELLLNFRHPYFAINPADFWRRWHISLSTWLRDYLYIPLGGNRHGRARTYRNLLITMFLGGLWHGAQWHFVAWGVFHGLLLVAHRRWVAARETGRFRFLDRPFWQSRLAQVLMIAAYFQATCLGWLLFGVRGLSDVPVLLSNGLMPVLQGGSALMTLLVFAGPLLLLEWAEERREQVSLPLLWPRPWRLACYACIVIVIVLCGAVERHEFIYFQF